MGTLGSTNGDFEAGTLAGWASTNWGSTTGAATVSTAAALSGNYGCRIYGSSEFEVALYSTTFPVTFGTISFDYMLAETSGSVEAQVSVLAYTSDAVEIEIPIGTTDGVLSVTTTQGHFSVQCTDIDLTSHAASWGANTRFQIRTYSL